MCQVERFNEAKTIELLLKFALSFASGNVYDLSSVDRYEAQLKKVAKKESNTAFLLTYCLGNGDNFGATNDEDELNYELNCLDDLVQRKLAIMLHGLVKVGHVNCNKKEAKEKICTKLKPKMSAPIAFYSRLPDLKDDSVEEEGQTIKTSDYKKIVEAVLGFLPGVTVLTDDRFKVNSKVPRLFKVF